MVDSSRGMTQKVDFGVQTHTPAPTLTHTYARVCTHRQNKNKGQSRMECQGGES